jgi:hypothetical protein
MKHINCLITTLLITGLMMALPAMADETMPHQTHKGMEMTHAVQKGQLIRETKVDGYTLVYHLIDMKSLMPNMADMAGTYHLMVSITDPKGLAVDKATVGYLVKGPDGSVQKVMTMGMADGFGANVHLMAGNNYTITAKAVTQDGTKLLDTFTFSLE